jgi:NADPH-dependent curcumin reductase CurA
MRIRCVLNPLQSTILLTTSSMQGFIVTDYASQFPQAKKELAQWLSEGKLQRKETIVKGGLQGAQQALVDLFNGVNTGKSPRLRDIRS